MGSALAARLPAQAEAAAQAGPAGATTFRDIAASFDRIARAIRRTILLASVLDHPPKPTPARSTIDADPVESVEDEDPPDQPDPIERLDRLEAAERVETPERPDDLTKRPIATVIAEIAHDLGVPVPDIATAAACAAARPIHPAPHQALTAAPNGTPTRSPPYRPDG